MFDKRATAAATTFTAATTRSGNIGEEATCARAAEILAVLEAQQRAGAITNLETSYTEFIAGHGRDYDQQEAVTLSYEDSLGRTTSIRVPAKHDTSTITRSYERSVTAEIKGEKTLVGALMEGTDIEAGQYISNTYIIIADHITGQEIVASVQLPTYVAENAVANGIKLDKPRTKSDGRDGNRLSTDNRTMIDILLPMFFNPKAETDYIRDAAGQIIGKLNAGSRSFIRVPLVDFAGATTTLVSEPGFNGTEFETKITQNEHLPITDVVNALTGANGAAAPALNRA